MKRLRWIATDLYASVDGFTVRAWENFDDWSWAVVPDGTVHAAACGYADTAAGARRAAAAALAKLLRKARS